MERFEIKPLATAREATLEYLFDMIAEMAGLARRTGEPGVAIHLEAILSARKAEDVRRRA